MSVLDRLRGTTDDDYQTLDESAYENTIALLESDIAQLERALFEPGWQRLSMEAERQFTRTGLDQIARLARFLKLKNPLLRRASALKNHYVHGQGVEIAATDPDVNNVISGFVSDPDNRRAVFGPQARESKEGALHTDGNVFLSCFTHPRTGRVQVRGVKFDEVRDVIFDPDDQQAPWFYERHYTRVFRDPTSGAPQVDSRRELHPDLDYWPRVRSQQWAGMRVRWDAPMLHVPVNRPDGWTFGVPELYPALDWARAHSEYLDDFRRLVKVLAKFLWQTRTKGSRVGQVAGQLASATVEDAPVGQTYVRDEGAGELSTVRTSGVQIEARDARQFALMVSAATDVPETMLLGDPSTGNLATAQTLDRPTELAFETRRGLWAGVYQRLCAHQIREAVRAPGGPLSGVVGRDEWGRLEITLRGDTQDTVSVDWPPLEERSMGDVISALVGSQGGAVDVPGMPADVLLRTALVVLDVDDPDRVVEDAMAAMEDASDEEASEMVEALRDLRDSLTEAAA